MKNRDRKSCDRRKNDHIGERNREINTNKKCLFNTIKDLDNKKRNKVKTQAKINRKKDINVFLKVCQRESVGKEKQRDGQTET
jgi:hypothetical protein